MLKNIAANLDQRVRNDAVGGWSTNHTNAMHKLSLDIYTHLGRGGSNTDPKFLADIAKKMETWDKELFDGGWSTQNHDFFVKTIKEISYYLGKSN